MGVQGGEYSVYLLEMKLHISFPTRKTNCINMLYDSNINFNDMQHIYVNM